MSYEPGPILDLSYMNKITENVEAPLSPYVCTYCEKRMAELEKLIQEKDQIIEAQYKILHPELPIYRPGCAGYTFPYHEKLPLIP